MKKILWVTLLLHGGIALGSTPDAVSDFKGATAIAPLDKILKLEADLNGDGRKEILLCLKSDYVDQKNNREPQPWYIYIATATGAIMYNKSQGTETTIPNQLSVGDVPAIDVDRYFVGQITELGKPGIVTIRYDSPREGPTVGIIYAYTIEGAHLKRTELARYPDSTTPHAMYAKYLAEGKRTTTQPVELSP